jgi:hypothetical protein
VVSKSSVPYGCNQVIAMPHRLRTALLLDYHCLFMDPFFTLSPRRRAVVLEPSERRAYTLVQQLNTLRNAKLKKRQEMQARRRVAHEKKKALDEAGRRAYNKEERKKRYVEEGQKAKRAAQAEQGGRKKKRQRREDDD